MPSSRALSKMPAQARKAYLEHTTKARGRAAQMRERASQMAKQRGTPRAPQFSKAQRGRLSGALNRAQQRPTKPTRSGGGRLNIKQRTSAKRSR